MFEPGAQLLVNPKPSWHKFSWMAEFVGSISQYKTNTIETVQMALKARQYLKDYAENEGFKFFCEDRGILHVYQDAKEFAHARRANDLLRQGGLNRQNVSADEALTIEPAIKANLLGGFYTRDDFSGDIHSYARNLSEACEKRGVKFIYNSDVGKVGYSGTGIDVSWANTLGDDQATFDSVVVCAGVGSRSIASQLGDRVNIYPVKGYSITVNLNDDESRAAAPWVSLLDDKAKIVASRLGNERYRIAGTAEFNGYNRDDRIRPLVEWCEELFPGVSTEHVVPWVGLRPMMPNMLPRVSAGRYPGVFYNTGRGRLGWTLSAATSEIVAELILSSSRTSSKRAA